MRVFSWALALVLLAPAAACRRPEGAVPPVGETAPAAANPAPPAAVTEHAPADAGAPAPAAWAMPMPDLGYNAREGRALFGHYCSTCHGAQGQGDGFNAYNLDPRPRDLSDPAFQAKKSDEEIASVIRGGGPSAGLSTGMPPWGRTLNRRQVDDLVAYLRTLKPAES